MYGCGFSAFRLEARGAMKAALVSAENLQLSLQPELSQEEQALTRARRCHDHKEAQGPGYGHQNPPPTIRRASAVSIAEPHFPLFYCVGAFG